MYEELFVPVMIAVALKEVGFDEPCMAIHEHYEHEDILHSKLLINYSNQPINPVLYNETIKVALLHCPDLLNVPQNNSKLPTWLFAAPIYEQVFDWLHQRGLNIHDLFIAKDVFKKGADGAWMVTITDTLTGKMLWPARIIEFTSGVEQNTDNMVFNIKRNAWDAAIFAAIKMLNDANKNNA